ncbi:hypothetical protein ACFCXR_15315 [Streptomyces noursei]|uniref:hypothetical protein n=1 Tax=Streptomyces noursei TaxID=1971 RepID=UPI00045EE55A|nr:hypothetical protein [Streptomyces noursei]AIA03441.1 hypothetical protein DC74_2941 [Streptomyces noursei]
MADYRYIAARASTGDVLHWNLPLSEVEYGPELSGPGSLKGTLPTALRRTLSATLDAGDTVLLVERNARLAWGGVLWRTEPEGNTLPVEAAGFTSYLHRRYDLHGNLDGRGPYIDADPCDVIRDVWAYAQAQPDGDLGVTVDDTSSQAKTGTARNPYTTSKTDPRNLGDIVDEMAKVDNGPEWSETVAWRGRRAERRIILGAPRLGRRRDDLTVSTGANVVGTPHVIEDADSYAQWVIGLGAGEGKKRAVIVDGARNGRLRLEHVLETNEKDAAKLQQRAYRERLARQVLPSVTELDIVDHPAAPIEALHIGDDVRIRLFEPHTEFDGWCRIVGWTVKPGGGETAERVTLKLERTNKPEDNEGQEQ